MRRFIPILVLASGLLTGCFGIVWAVVTGVAVPDQNPTPAMQQRADFHNAIVSNLLLIGAGLFAIALIGLIVQVTMRLSRNRTARSTTP